MHKSGHRLTGIEPLTHTADNQCVYSRVCVGVCGGTLLPPPETSCLQELFVLKSVVLHLCV